MKNIVLGTLVFAAGAFAPGLALTLVSLMSPPAGVPPRPDPTGDFLMVVIYYGYTNGLRTLAFALSTALSPAWRNWSTKRAITTAGVLGLTSPITALLVLALIVKAILPMFHSAPWLAIVLSNGVPGLVLGLVAILIARAWRPAKPA